MIIRTLESVPVDGVSCEFRRFLTKQVHNMSDQANPEPNGTTRAPSQARCPWLLNLGHHHYGSQLKMLGLRKAGYLTLWCAVAIAVLVALYWHNLNYPPCCDAEGYGVIALGIKRVGLFGPWPFSEFRTYGYPLFVSLVSSEYDLPGLPGFTPNVAIVQSALYIAACLALFFVVYPTSRPMAWCCAVGLLSNPFVLNYVPLRLTEGLNASVLVALTAVASALSLRERGLLQQCALIVTGSMLTGFALVLRPANVVLLGAWLGFLVFHISQAGKPRMILSICAVVGLIIPVLPQILLNAAYHGIPTPFPIIGSMGYQVEHGLVSLKMETNASGIGPCQLFYRNPFIDLGEASSIGWQAYLWRPQHGIPTMFAHIFNSLNHSYFFTYLHDLRLPWYYIPMNAANHLVLFAAAGSAIWFLLSRRLQTINGTSVSTADGVLVFLLMGFILTCGVNGVVQPETRFGLAVFCLSGPLAAWGIYKWSFANSKIKILTFVLCLLYVVSAKLVSDWTLTLVQYFDPLLPDFRGRIC